MKPESLVIAYQNDAVNTFPGLVHTARHTTRVGRAEKWWSNPQGKKLLMVKFAIGVKS